MITGRQHITSAFNKRHVVSCFRVVYIERGGGSGRRAVLSIMHANGWLSRGDAGIQMQPRELGSTAKFLNSDLEGAGTYNSIEFLGLSLYYCIYTP